MIRIAALDNQKSLRDLAGLPRLCDEVVWLDTDKLATATEPVVIVGLWLAEEPSAAKQLLARRSEAGLATLVVPRFKAGDLRVVLKAPTAVRVKMGEYEAFQWDDGSTIAVPGQTVLATTLHTGQWGEVAGLGVTVLSVRAHHGAGAVVLCTAGMTSRQLSVDVAQQRRLLERIIERTVSIVASVKVEEEPVVVVPAASMDELLASGDGHIAAVVLAVTVADGSRNVDVVASTAGSMGFDVPKHDLHRTLARMPEASVTELERTLRTHGWGAYLRRGRLALVESK